MFKDGYPAPNYAMHAVAVVASVVPVLIGLRGVARGWFGHASAAVVCGLFVLRAAEDHLDHFSLLQGTQAISEILQSAVAVGA